MTRASSVRGNTNTTGQTHKKGKRGAPQTFARKLFDILQEGTPIVGWSEGGDSFTVHNDKDFERDILTAHYRHSKFSSFQRQLNMYGFRKVADCSDRTYSHPYFRRNQVGLLPQVRRVTSADNNTNDRNKKRPAGGIAVPAPAAAAVAAARREEDEEDDRSSSDRATTGESDAGDNESASLPPRKKQRCFVEQTTATGAEAAAAGGGVGGGRLLRRPLQYWVDAEFGGASSAAAGGGASLPPVINVTAREAKNAAGVRLYQQQVEAQQQQQQQQQMANVGAGTAQRPEYSGAWYQHTGLWGGVSNMDDAWTSCSASSPPPSSVEASSPVLLPINAADLACKNSANVPPFKLIDSELPVSGVVNDMDINDPSFVGAMASSAGLGGVSVDWRGGNPSDAAGVGGVVDANIARCGSPPLVQVASAVANASAGLFYGGWDNNGRAGDGSGAACGGSTSAAAAEVGVRAGSMVDNPLCLDKAFGFGEALARCPSFDLIFDTNELILDPVVSGEDNTTTPVPISPTLSPGEDENVKQEVVAAATNNAAAATASGSVGWDLANFGGAGWGSPETADTAAAGPWAALPPWGSSPASKASLAPPGGQQQEPAVGNNSATGGLNNKHTNNSAASVVEGGGYGEPNVVGGAQQQQQGGGGGGGGGLHKRTLSTISRFSLGLGGGDSSSAVDQLDWSLLADADATGGVNADYVPSLVGLTDAAGGAGGGGGFDDTAAFAGIEVGAAPVGMSSSFSLLGVSAASSYPASVEVSPVTSCDSSSASSPIVDGCASGAVGNVIDMTLINGRRRSFFGVDDAWGLGLSEPRQRTFA